jgi:hypothetical protein
MLVRSFRALLAFGIATCPAILIAQTLSGTAPLQYTALQIPCRAFDTRVTGGPIAAGTSQSDIVDAALTRAEQEPRPGGPTHTHIPHNILPLAQLKH